MHANHNRWAVWKSASFATLLSLGLAGCGGGGGGSSATGTASLALTDAPVCQGLQKVVVTVDSIDLVGDSGGTHTLAVNPPQQIDLTTLTNGATLPLGAITLPAGTYQQLRLVLAANTGNSNVNPANYVVDALGNTVALTTPSAQTSGYKIVGSFTVPADGAVDLTVDFNACRSVVKAGNSGKYLLKPVLRLIQNAQSGAIKGYVTAANAGAVVMAEDSQGHILRSTVAQVASGASMAMFNLAPLPGGAASSPAIYNVIIAPPAPASTPVTPNFAPAVVTTVPVVAGQTTPLGPASTPLPMTAASGSIGYTGTIALVNPAATLVVAQQTLPASAGSAPVISIAQTNGVQDASSSTTQTYALQLPDIGTFSAPYAPPASGPYSFAPVGSASAPLPTILRIFASDGEEGSTTSQTGTVTMQQTTNNNFDLFH